MIPTTWTALLLLAIAVLPGAMFTFAFERHAGSFGVTLADRVLRFVAVSLAFDALYAWPAYAAYRAWFADRPFAGGQFAVAWCGTVAAAAAPALLGSAFGGLYVTRTTQSGWGWLRRRLLRGPREAWLLDEVLGHAAAPRAWDYFFSSRPKVYLRVRTTAGAWIGGRFAAASYAGGFPHERDLYLEMAWPVDADGTFGNEPLGYPVYVPEATIAYVEVVPASGDEEVSTHV